MYNTIIKYTHKPDIVKRHIYKIKNRTNLSKRHAMIDLEKRDVKKLSAT